MSGTNYSKPSLRQLTQLGLPLRWRVVGFVAAVTLGSFIIGRIDTSVWQRVKQLERDFAAIKTERFYNAVQIRSSIRQLNDDLFRYHLKGDQGDLQRFQVGAEEFNQLIIARRDESDSSQEIVLFRQIEAAFAKYMQDTA